MRPFSFSELEDRMDYKVKRPHQGDKWYDEGDTRVADERDVAHLVASGVLVPKTSPKAKTKTKAAVPPETKTSE